MKRSLKGAAAGLALFGAGSALAADMVLYVKTKDTKVVKTASPTAAAVTTLQPGAEVTFSEAEKGFAKIKAGAKAGYTLLGNLTKTKAQPETTSDGKTVLGNAVASSGAATRALSRSGQNYANSKGPDAMKAGQQVVLVEGINYQVAHEAPAKAGKSKGGGK